MDNRQKTPANILDSEHQPVTVDEGFCMYDPLTNRYLFKPDRGSGGFSLYSTESRATQQRGARDQGQASLYS
jgi:hypothetical protein